MVSGFSCQIGGLEFDSFSWGSNSVGGAFESVNLPDAVVVTPENGANGIGFNFSNLGLSFTAPGSNITAAINFNVAALSGTIDGAYEALGAHTFTGSGESFAFFEDGGSLFQATVADPVEQVFGFPVRLTDSVSFPDVVSLALFSGGSAIVDNPGGTDPGTATTSDYTVLLVPAAAVVPTGSPEPATISLLGVGILGLAQLRRRK